MSPRTFPVRVRAGSRLSQIRFTAGDGRLDDAGHRALHAAAPLVAGAEPVIAGGVAVSIDLAGFDGTGLVGYRAKRHTGVIDVDLVDALDPSDYWEAIHVRARRELILDPGEFYLLASKEAVRVPPDHAAEMTPFDPLVGEFRVHYAGFFDPGFGCAEAGGAGSRAVLEVRSRDVPFVLEDGQIVGRLVYERMSRAAAHALRRRGGVELPGAGAEAVEALPEGVTPGVTPPAPARPGTGRAACSARRRARGSGRSSARAASAPRGRRRGPAPTSPRAAARAAASWAGPTSTLGPISPSRCATRWWWLSTGSAGMRSVEKDSTAALVFGPTPGMAASQARAASGSMSARKSSVRAPWRSRTSRSTCRMRGALASGQVTPRISASTSAVSASTRSAQSGKRARSALKARPDSALRVRCDSSEETSSLSGSRLWK